MNIEINKDEVEAPVELVEEPLQGWSAKLAKPFQNIEDGVAVISVLLLALLPFSAVIARFFKTGIPYSTEYTSHMVVVLTFIAGMITSREKKHLSLSLALPLKEVAKKRIHTANMFIAALMTTSFCWSTVDFILNAFGVGQKVGIFSIRLVTMVMVVGYLVMTVRFILSVPKEGKKRLIAWSSLLFGTILAWESIGNIVMYFSGEMPGFMETLVGASHSINGFIALPLIILLIVAAIFGTPLFVVLGGIGYVLFARMAEPLVAIPNEAFEMLKSHAIPAIPLFTVAGFLLSESKSGERLVRLFKAFFGWFPGGQAIMAILVCSFFTTFTGASGVTILALGALLAFVLEKGKYKKNFSIGLITASGSVGLLFPPSLPIIIYGVIAGISIKDMFVGGLMPGVVMVLVLVIFSVVYATKNKAHREPFKLKEAFAALRASVWEILLPVVIVLGFFGGITTLVESSAIAVIYALIVEVFIHRDLKLKELPRVFLKCIPIIGGVLIILSMAKGLSYYIVDAEIPMKLTEWAQAAISSKYIFLLLLNIMLLITGCLMDIFSAIMVVVPLIIPLGELFGIHPVHLGIIFLANMELGYMTPPVGLNLFLASYRFNEPMGKLYRDVLPFFLIQLIAVLLITYIPFLSTALLGLF
ncbi:MAG: TRAP transporter large permease subunit [bacterium]|nr:TRAP transporter large permease subunit [bacterium]